MSLELRLLLSVGLAFALVLIATPYVIRLANRLNFQDKPAAGYKDHGQPTPYLGGLAVMGGFIIVVALLSGSPSRTLPVIAGIVVLWALGTVDDRRPVSPGLRVLVEAALATALWALDLGWNLGLGSALDLILTILWVLAVVNAINLFDNMDGQASTMALVISIGIGLLGLAEGDQWVAVSGAALAGSCLGFLRYNLASPAKIFLGDGGSMPLGFALAALVMIGASESAAAAQALAMGVLFVGVPALDTALVIVSRRRRGISVLTGGRDHLTHRSRERLRTATAVAFALGGSQAVLAALALASYKQGSIALVIVILFYLLAAGGLIIFLDRRTLPAGNETAAAEPDKPSEPPSALAALLAKIPWETAAIVPLAAVIAASPWYFGGYGISLWAPGGLVLLVVLMALVIGRPIAITKPAAAAFAGLFGLAVWSLISSSWSPTSHFAVVNADRWLFYALALAVLAMLVRDTKIGAILLSANGLGILLVVVVVYIRLLGSDPSTLLAGGRLNSPMDYINGLGTYLAMGLWGAIALAEQRRRLWLSALGALLAGLTVPLLLLSESRGVTLALAASAAVVLCLVPGRLRRLAFIVLLAAVAVADTGVTRLAFQARNASHPLLPADAQTIFTRAVVVAILACVIWTFVCWFVDWCRQTHLDWLLLTRRAMLGLLAIGTIGIGVTAIVSSSQISRTVDKQYRTFIKVGKGSRVQSADTRLLSSKGNRYDYWRVASKTWAQHPIIGAGAASFPAEYSLYRQTVENVRQPHSLEFETLSELGLIGALLLLLFVGSVFYAAGRRGRRLRSSALDRVVLVAPLGAFTAWLVDVSVDWVHLLTGVTAVAICSAAVLLRPTAGGLLPASVDFSRLSPRARWSAGAIGAVILLGAGALLSQLTLTDRYVTRAQEELQADPRAAVADADRALRLDPTLMQAYYIKAGALEGLGNTAGTKRALLKGASEEPRNFVIWALLGDFAARSGDLKTAKAYYQRSLSLNPGDPGIADLVLNPAMQPKS